MLKFEVIWNFLIKIYDFLPIRTALLKLQDRDGLDISLILTLIWVGLSCGRLHTEQTESLQALSTQWNRYLLRPLRQARATSRPIPILYSKLKKIELAAEKQALKAYLRAIKDVTTPPSRLAALTNILKVYPHIKEAEFKKLLDIGQEIIESADHV